MRPLLRVENLRTEFASSYGSLAAVNDVSFELYQGETLGIVGESGSGKSVTLRSVMRLILPPGRISAGKIVYGDKELLDLSDKKMEKIRGKEISMIFQEPSAALNPVLTIGEQITEVLKIHRNMNRSDAQKQAADYLRQVGMPAPERRVKSYPHQLSGGMQQRCVIAIALACQAKIIFADEPTTALDVTIQAQILSLLRKLVEAENKSMIFISHDIGAVAQVADRLLVMYMGKIMESGSLDEIIDAPRHPYTKELLRSLPSMANERKTRLAEIQGEIPDQYHIPSGCPFSNRCPIAEDICRLQEPPMKNENDRFCYCHF